MANWNYQHFSTDDSDWVARLEKVVLEYRPRPDGIRAAVVRPDPSYTAWFHLWVRDDQFNAKYEIQVARAEPLGQTVATWLAEGATVPLVVNMEKPPRVWVVRITENKPPQ
jgi:hypothetical protein